MSRLRTFGIKIPKQTRSREIPDEKKGSYRAPLTSSVMTRHLDFKIQEIPKDIQVSKVARSIHKRKNHLRNLIQKCARALPENKPYFEHQILRTQQHIFNKEVKLNLLNKELDAQEKRRTTQRENEKKEEIARKINAEKALKFQGTKPVTGAKSNVISKIEAREAADKIFLKKEKIVKSSSGSVKIVRNRRKTWSNT